MRRFNSPCLLRKQYLCSRRSGIFSRREAHMVSNEESTVVGVFPDHSRAERAIKELHSAGFDYEQIGIARREGVACVPAETMETGSTAEVAAGGAVTGGALGALAGAAL